MALNEENDEYINQLLYKLATVPDVDGITINAILAGTLAYQIKENKFQLIILNSCEEKTIFKCRIIIQVRSRKVAYERMFCDFFYKLRKSNQEKIINKIEEYIITHG